jgi:hypothetical protein
MRVEFVPVISPPHSKKRGAFGGFCNSRSQPTAPSWTRVPGVIQRSWRSPRTPVRRGTTTNSMRTGRSRLGGRFTMSSRATASMSTARRIALAALPEPALRLRGRREPEPTHGAGVPRIHIPLAETGRRPGPGGPSPEAEHLRQRARGPLPRHGCIQAHRTGGCTLPTDCGISDPPDAPGTQPSQGLGRQPGQAEAVPLDSVIVSRIPYRIPLRAAKRRAFCLRQRLARRAGRSRLSTTATSACSPLPA